MRAALAARDTETLRREAHALLGMFGNFRAAPAMRIAAALDRERGDDDPVRLTVLIGELENELALLAPHLRAAS